METDLKLDQHISQRFNEELESLRAKVLEMGGLVEQQVVDGTEALISNDAELGQQVVDRDSLVNSLEVEIDDACVEIIKNAVTSKLGIKLPLPK